MIKYILKRLLLSVPTLIGITLVTFLIMRLTPGDPMQAVSGGMMTKYSREHHQKFMEYYGFNKPLMEQYAVWLTKVVRLEFGNSFVDNRPVMEVIAEKLPVTIYLNLLSILIIFLISIPAGVYSAVKRDKLFDKVSGIVFFMLYSLFVPWVSIFLISTFSIQLKWFPIRGLTLNDSFSSILWHSVLPVIVMSYSGFAFLARITRGSVLDVLSQEYIVTARSKGLPESTVMQKHALRNALIPLVTIFGTIFPTLIGGSVIIERIFNIDGMGNLFFLSISSRDWFMVMGLTTISAVMTLLGILISDILYAVVDPRIRYD